MICTDLPLSSATWLLWDLVAHERTRWVWASEGVWGGQGALWSFALFILPQIPSSPGAATSKRTHDDVSVPGTS